MRPETQNRVTRKPLTTALLAAACAGMLTPTPAQATPAVETTDYGNSFATRDTTLPPGTDSVTGILTAPTDFNDFFTLVGLTPSQPVTFNYSASTTANNSNLSMQMFNDAGGFLANNQRFFQPGDGIVTGSFAITVPANGVLVVDMNLSESGSGVLSYTLSVPEPSSAAALLGLGALALLGHRKAARKNQDSNQP